MKISPVNQQSAKARTDTQIEVFIKLVAVLGEFGLEAEKCEDVQVRRGLYFFLPMWLHAQAMSDSLQSRSHPAMWNLPALAALARATMECFVNLAYFSEAVSPAQWELRQLLWERQLKAKFVEIMSEREGLSDELKASVQQVGQQLGEIQSKITQSIGIKELPIEVAKRVLKKPDSYLTTSQEDIWVRAGLERAAFRYHWRALSQWTHNTPLSVYQQVHFREPASADEVSMTVRVASEMLYRAATLMPQLDALRAPLTAVGGVYAEFFPTKPGAEV